VLVAALHGRVDGEALRRLLAAKDLGRLDQAALIRDGFFSARGR
jgi:hypothetical protein